MESKLSDLPFTIFAPSYKRADSHLTQRWLPEATLVVHESEADAYRKEGARIIVAPDGVKGNIARVRNWVMDYAREKGITRYVMMDDDISQVSYWRCSELGENRKWTVIPHTRSTFLEFLEFGYQFAEEWGVRLFGVNPAMGDKGAYREYTPFSTTSYISGSLHCHINPELRYDENLPLKKDFDFCIQECNATRRILRFNWAFLIKKDHQNLGGCAGYRTTKREQDQFMAFQRKWGEDIVRIDGGQSKTHTKKTRGDAWDVNPIIRIPIKGV